MLFGRVLADFGRAWAGFRQDLGGSGRISAGCRLDLGAQGIIWEGNLNFRLDFAIILLDFGRAWGGFRQDLEDLAGLRQDVGWIWELRAEFGRKIIDSSGVWWLAPVLPRYKHGANLVLARRKARGPYLTSYQK